MTVFRAGDRVQLTAAALAETWLTGDIGRRIGVVARVDGWPVIAWSGLVGDCRMKPGMLEIANG